MRTITGRVVSTKMNKTVVVAVERLATHPLYKKQYKQTSRYKAHDEQNTCQIGDVVEITETRPLSRDKHFAVSRVVESVATKPAGAQAAGGVK